MYKPSPRIAFTEKNTYWLITDKYGNDCTGNLYTYEQAKELCNYLNSHTEEFAETFLSDMINGYVSFNFID